MEITIVWTQEDCPLCERVKETLGAGNYEERRAEDLIGGFDRDMDAMAQLAMQNMELPLIRRGATWLRPQDILGDAAAA